MNQLLYNLLFAVGYMALFILTAVFIQHHMIPESIAGLIILLAASVLTI